MNRKENAQLDSLRALPRLLLPWYEKSKRDLPWRRTSDPYEILVSEIMLQQTRVEAVIPYYRRFLALFPNPAALAAADDDTLLKAWEGLGYYSRARNLKKAAASIAENGFPTTEDDLKKLPGVGAYTAGAIGSIAFNLPTPAVDGNLLRIFARLTASTEPIGPKLFSRCYEAIAGIYPPDASSFTQSFMDLGALVCTPKNPKCALCPLSSICAAHKNGTASRLPVRKEKKPRPEEKRTVFVLRQGKTIAVEKRPEQGLLRGMWALPNTEGWLNEDEAAAYLSRMGVHFTGTVTVRHEKHIFTHLTWLLRVYDGEADGIEAFTVKNEDEVALPTAFRICLGER